MKRNDILSAISVSLVLIVLSLFWSGSRPADSVSNVLVTSVFVSICGDGIVQTSGNEVCDDGVENNTGGYSPSIGGRICNATCTGFGPYCGDNILQVRFGEECDDGNNTSGDLCSATCTEEDPPPGGAGPARGSIPSQSEPKGSIPAITETRVVVKGKAYPSTVVHVLLDGEEIGTAQSDTNADFLFSSAEVTPGRATFGFWALDTTGTRSTTLAATFEIMQSAVTTINSVLIPPTISVGGGSIDDEPLLMVTGQSVPAAKVFVHLVGGTDASVFEAETEANGAWALQLDTNSLSRTAQYSVRAYFEKETAEGTIASGFSSAVTFTVDEGGEIAIAGDINRDGKVNLVDFSILLFHWNTSEPSADFNRDGVVNLTDFSIMLFNWTG